MHSIWKYLILATSTLLIIGCVTTDCPELPKWEEKKGGITNSVVISLDTFYLKFYPTHVLDDSGNIYDYGYSEIQNKTITRLIENNKIGDTLLMRFYVTIGDYGTPIIDSSTSEIAVKTIKDTVMILRYNQWETLQSASDKTVLGKSCACSLVPPHEIIDSIHIEYNPQKKITLLSIQDSLQ